jgi:predicted alpha/beta-fold hydrolase
MNTPASEPQPASYLPDPFVPHPRLRNGHVMTVYAWARARSFPNLPPPVKRLFDVAPRTQVSADCYWQPRRQESPLVLGLHGLEGSSEAHYMQGLASKAFGAGFSVVLLNQRNCGGTEHLCPGLYHSGLTEDAAGVLIEMVRDERIDRIAVAGYSLGGNLALKLAGDFGSDAPPELRAVCAVSPIIEISKCVDALEKRQNIIYQWNFVKDLKARMRRKAQHFPGAFAVDRLASVRTVRQFDEVYTAPHFGFRDAQDYYHRASAMRVVGEIRVPTLIITAADDPFVPASMLDAPAVRNNPNITTVVTRHGGHCGFVADPQTADGRGDDYWAEASIIRFARGFC